MGEFGRLEVDRGKKTLLSLTLVRLCEETLRGTHNRAHRAVTFALAQLSCAHLFILSKVFFLVSDLDNIIIFATVR